MNDQAWKSFKGQVKDQTFSEIEEAADSIEHNELRVKTARARLKSGLKGEDLMETKEELAFAISDLQFAKAWLGRAISQANKEQLELLGKVDDDAQWKSQEEARFRSMPHEIARKEQLEKQLGSSIAWNDYWKYLDNLYADQESVSQERYSETVRSYGWDFDSGRADALFPSDLGLVRSVAQLQMISEVKTSK